MEQILGAEPGRHFPSVLVAAVPVRRRTAAGVRAFLESTQPHHVLTATIRAAEILGMLLDDEDVTRFCEHRNELAGLLLSCFTVSGTNWSRYLALLPTELTVGRADTTEAIGNVLLAKANGAGHRTIAATLDRPESTVRR